jgi:hypothetical protein
VPAAAVPALTDKEEFIEPFDGGVTDAGLKAQLAPDGQPVTTKATAVLNPFDEFIVTVEFPAVPCVSVSVVGLAEIEKFGTGGVVTVPDTVVVWTSVPLVPVTVTVNGPALVLVLVAMVSVEVVAPFAGGFTLVKLTLQAAPVGQPARVSPTAPVNPLNELTVTVELPDPPCVMAGKDARLADSEKSGVALYAWTQPPPLAFSQFCWIR